MLRNEGCVGYWKAGRCDMKKLIASSVAFLLAGAFSARADLDLNGTWEFAFADKTALEDAAKPDFTATDKIVVPGVFDAMPKWLMKKGTGLYRRTFTLERPVDNAWLVVDGMGLRGEFRIDGKKLGLVALPWSKFELETGPLAAGTHTLFAALENRLDPERMKLFMPDYDFYSFGGFFHGVRLAFANARAYVRTRDWRVGEVEIEVEGAGGETVLVFDGKNEVKANFKDGKAVVRVPDFRLWSPEYPNLHTVKMGNSGAGYGKREVCARFGIREVKATARGIELNGKPVFLKGVNRHEMHPATGPATPESVMVQDIQLVKSLGCNFIRLPHYPASQRFLDFCDEAGILVWEESLGWGNKDKEMSDPEFVRLQVEQTDLMVKNSFNHPSVIIFAFMNELDSQTEVGKALVEKLATTIRKRDSGRLVSFATYHNTDDISHVYSDVVSFNSYPGWIDWGFKMGDKEEMKARMEQVYAECVKYYRTKYPGKPILISETGACGLYGKRDAAASSWSEDYEAEYNGNAIDWAMAPGSGVCGITLWQFADATSYGREHLNPGARGKVLGQNLGGLFDGYRREKQTVQAVRERFTRKHGCGRGVYINSDAWNFFFTGKDWRGYTVEQLKREIEKDVDWYADRGGVEALFYNLNFQRCFWPTKAGTPYWKDLELDKDGNLLLRGVKLTEQDGVDEYRRMYLAAKPMWDTFPDFLKYRYAYCHRKGVEMWHSLRANDVHHTTKGQEGRPQHGDLWRTRPDLHRAEYRTSGKHTWTDRGLDYGQQEVRDYHLALARELLLDYESDGMELDFMRHMPVFKPGYDEANAPLLTEFVRGIRRLCDEAEKKWGHKLRMAVRVPAYPADALGLGMDVPTWVKEGLIDIVIPSPCGLDTVSDTQVALWRAVCPEPVVLAPCIDYEMQIRWESRLLFDLSTDLGFASSFYNQGADTVYFYNHYPRDRETHPDMPETFATCGDRAAVASRARRCVLTGSGQCGEGRYWTSRYPIWGLPKDSFAGGAKINVGDDVKGRAATVVVGASCKVEVDVYVNGEKCAPTDAAKLPRPLPKLAKDGQWIVADVPAGVLHDGWNLVELVNRAEENLGEWRICWTEIDISEK